jgi:hypothetical protein
VDGDRFIGKVEVRHRLTDALRRHGGRVGYSIRPTMRRRGYGTFALSLVLVRCLDLGLDRILVTCDESNTASRRIIETNGGVLQDCVQVGDSAVPIASFTIAALHIGLLGAAVVVGLTVAALFGLLWLILRWDRSRRTRRLPPGALATAGASVRVAEVAGLNPTIHLRYRSTALLAGDVEVTSTAFAWKPRDRYRRRGATDVVLSLGDIREVNCLRPAARFVATLAVSPSGTAATSW